MDKRILAFDFGASSGRAMIGSYADGQIRLEEVHRFSNDPVKVRGTVYWDVLRLFFEIKQGILKAQHAGGFDTIGIDTWGVDFGLLDENGVLLENPTHYRDEAFTGCMNKVLELIPPERLYGITGMQNMDINTISQLYYLRNHRPELLERASTLLFMPDLLRYLLTGEKVTEYTIASTSQLLDAGTRDWSWEVIDALDLPRRIFTPIVRPGTVTGSLSQDICEELGVPAVPVIAVGEHDTASAVVSVPAKGKDFIYVSCGTWSLFGTELDVPLRSDTAREHNVTNEGGVAGTIRFLKNISGLWMIQESRRQWIREGREFSYAELEKMALACEPFQCFIDPDDPRFTPQGNHPRRVREYCRETGQHVPESEGEIMRCIYESLALKYRYTREMITQCTGKEYGAIHIVGGGTKDNLLCQMTANATGLPVTAGPIEATALGNVAVQLIAVGQLADVAEARKVIAGSQQLFQYESADHEIWNGAYERYKKALSL
ncbi:MAG: rhamnulokinase [Oscillospiraceae bacterium]